MLSSGKLYTIRAPSQGQQRSTRKSPAPQMQGLTLSACTSTQKGEVAVAVDSRGRAWGDSADRFEVRLPTGAEANTAQNPLVAARRPYIELLKRPTSIGYDERVETMSGKRRQMMEAARMNRQPRPGSAAARALAASESAATSAVLEGTNEAGVE